MSKHISGVYGMNIEFTKNQYTIILQILKNRLMRDRELMEKMKNDDFCDAKTYESMLDDCKELGIIIQTMEKL